ncbi:tyrosine/serin protein phosphatase IFN-gamma inhibitor [Equine molluscum contagiosum-like virus]|nr:tyrosine/serin protein phosphatase IFN-gamma inhibitor [Equine molluscum contagiosum-like virus]
MDKKRFYRRLILKSTSTPVTTRDEPQQVTRITEHVYLGSYNNAMSLQKHGVAFRYVLNVSMVKYTLPDPNVTVIHLPVPDNEQVDIAKYFDSVASFLEKCEKNKTPVLVHCIAGVNRSGAMVMAYLLHVRDQRVPAVIYFLHVYHGLKDLRGAFLENASFKKQLVDHYL